MFYVISMLYAYRCILTLYEVAYNLQIFNFVAK